MRDLEEILSKSSKSRLSVCGVTWKQVYECRCSVAFAPIDLFLLQGGKVSED